MPDIVWALRGLKHVAHSKDLVCLHTTLQKSLYLLIEAGAIVAVAAFARLRCLPVLLQGIFTMALFVWFHAASRPGNSTPRLLYCTMAMFLGLAWLLRDRRTLSFVIVVLSGCLLAGGAFLTVAGYSVT